MGWTRRVELSYLSAALGIWINCPAVNSEQIGLPVILPYSGSIANTFPPFTVHCPSPRVYEKSLHKLPSKSLGVYCHRPKWNASYWLSQVFVEGQWTSGMNTRSSPSSHALHESPATCPATENMTIGGTFLAVSWRQLVNSTHSHIHGWSMFFPFPLSGTQQ